jgi:hypothetical protein
LGLKEHRIGPTPSKWRARTRTAICLSDINCLFREHRRWFNWSDRLDGWNEACMHPMRKANAVFDFYDLISVLLKTPASWLFVIGIERHRGPKGGCAAVPVPGGDFPHTNNSCPHPGLPNLPLKYNWIRKPPPPLDGAGGQRTSKEGNN